MARHEKIQVPISIHVFGSEVVGSLIHAYEMLGEISFSLVLVPEHVARLEATASGGIEIAIAI